MYHLPVPNVWTYSVSIDRLLWRWVDSISVAWSSPAERHTQPSAVATLRASAVGAYPHPHPNPHPSP